jgi:hypothetical protein
MFTGLPVSGSAASGAPVPSSPRQPFGLTRYIDPSGVVVGSSDLNTGQNPTNVPAGTGPIRTTVELNNRLYGRNIVVNATITYLSDENTTSQLDLSTIGSANSSTLTFQGTPTITHTGGTLNAGTIAINSAAAGGGQSQVCHTSDVANFTIYTFFGGTSAHPQYIIDVTGGNNGTRSWIVDILGGVAVPETSIPITAAFGAGTLTIGDGYRIQQGTLLSVIQSSAPTGLGVTFNDIAFTALHVGFNGATYNNCSFDSGLLVGGTFNNCFFGADLTELAFPMGSVNINSGAIITLFGTGEVTSPLNLSGDVFITGGGMTIANDAYSSVFISPGIGAGIQIHRCVNEGLFVRGTDIDMGSGLQSPTLIWGKNNGLVGIGIGPRAGLSVSAAAATRPTVTGASGDFSFNQPNGGAIDTNARPWNEGAGAYGPSFPTTWANFAAVGVFNFQAHHPITDSSLIGV